MNGSVEGRGSSARERRKETRRTRARWVCLGAVLMIAAGSALLAKVEGQDRNFAGSVQGSYLYVHDGKNEHARQRSLDGFVTEMSVKVAVDFSDHISTNVKVCFGCHGFELGMAYVDLTVSDALRFRVGRFSPSFGEFQLRHDPANHRTVSKPLPYDMGRMVRLREWNLGVLPSPYVDNGIEVAGTHWFGTMLQVDYAAYAVGGLRGDNDALDVDFIQQRSGAFYYLDNNSRPAFGGRLSATVDLSDHDLTYTFGTSGMMGWYDPNHELSYVLGGVDLYARIKRVEVRAEYLLRRTEMSLGPDPASRFKYGPGTNGKYDRYALKDGFYVEAIVPVAPRFELVGRFDGLRRFGNVVATSAMRKESAVLRYTFGGDVSVGYGVRIKLYGEYYDFSDFDDEIAATVAVVSVL
ncbi:MAG: hypothetical protein ABW252_20435 [Polyangiales bacterium]